MATRPHLTITSFPFLPLTTTFTRPRDCGGISVTNVYIIDNKASCLPPDFAGTVGGFSSFFYSPGIACPSGYWTACHDTTGVSSITTVTCCPTYGADISLSCVADPRTLSGIWTSLFCTWIAPQRGTSITVTASDTAGRTSTVTHYVESPGGINAFGVRMVYEATDTETRETGATTTAGNKITTGDGSSSSPTPLETNPSPTDPSSSSSSSSSNLSGATIAAISVSAVLGLLLILILSFFLFRWRRKLQRQRQLQQQPPPPDPSVMSTSIPPTSSYLPPPPPTSTTAYGDVPFGTEAYPYTQAMNIPTTHPGVSYVGVAPNKPEPAELAEQPIAVELSTTREVLAAELEGSGVASPGQPYGRLQQADDDDNANGVHATGFGPAGGGEWW